jgi:hypothetical protein
MKSTISVVLLALVAALLLYEFVYKDWTYKRSALAQRDELMKVISPARARLAAIDKDVKACFDDLVKDRYSGERKTYCDKMIDENSKVGTEAQAATLILADLDSAVRRRYNGIPPAWW